MARIETVQLNFHSLEQIDDGRISALLKLHLARIAQDCMDRPGDKTDREVSLSFSAKPVPDETGRCDFVKFEIACKSKVPTYRSRPYQMKVTKGGFLFNQDFPDEIGQAPLFEKDGER